MSMLAVREAPGTATSASASRPIPALDVAEPAELGAAAPTDHAARADRLRTAIAHHRAALAALLDQRREHAVQLHGSGWKFGPIADLYDLTRERVRQIVTGAGATTDGCAEGVS